MTDKEAEAYMINFCTHPDARGLLDEVAPQLVALASKHNRAARLGTYAFLDAAYGHTDWPAENVKRRELAELRGYNLRTDNIREPWHIDVRYAAFFGCADPALLQKVIAVVKQPTHPLHRAATWSFESLCRQLPHMAAALNDTA